MIAVRRQRKSEHNGKAINAVRMAISCELHGNSQPLLLLQEQ